MVKCGIARSIATGGLMVMVMICSPLAWSGDEKRISSGTDWARFKISDYHTTPKSAGVMI